MAPSPIFLTLVQKKQLTHDVYELEYASQDSLVVLPGQFLLCDTCWDPKYKRSYSVSWAEGNSIFFIIKRLPEGTGGSVAICDQSLGHVMQAWGPMGQFVLRDTTCPKVFLWTGTGFAPLYFMLKAQVQSTTLPTGRQEYKVQSSRLFFLFGVRELRDMYYLDELQKWLQQGFLDYQIYCSRESGMLPEKHHTGRITEYFTADTLAVLNKANETEFYICGSPAMVKEVRGTLEGYGVSREKVFFEQY